MAGLDDGIAVWGMDPELLLLVADWAFIPLLLLLSLLLLLCSGGNQRETDRLRAQARQAKNAGKVKVGNTEAVKKKDSDADAMRKKQEAADAKKKEQEAELAKQKAGGQIVKAKIPL